jgi:hypothetical protein
MTFSHLRKKKKKRQLKEEIYRFGIGEGPAVKQIPVQSGWYLVENRFLQAGK